MRRLLCHVLLIAAAQTGFIAGPTAQSPSRVATSIAAIERYPGFYQGRLVSLVATPKEVKSLWQIAVTSPRTFVLLPSSGRPPTTRAEVRGLWFDVGRLSPDDSRLSMYGLRSLVQTLIGDGWPPPNSLFAIVNATWLEPPNDRSSSLRTVALQPETFDGRQVTLRGRFRGQNLYGDLPAWPRQSQWDFVLSTADASIWITGLRPRGRGFDLDPRSRRSSGASLQATGTIRVENGLPRLEAKTLEQVRSLDEETAEAESPGPPPEPPPTVIFSAPLNGERDVSATALVRIQFSRDMDGTSFEKHVRVAYADDTSAAPGAFTTSYRPLTRGLEVRFANPLSRGATVFVALGEGITASDGTPLAPIKITFTVER